MRERPRASPARWRWIILLATIAFQSGCQGSFFPRVVKERFEIRPTAGAGFAGLKTAEQFERPAISRCPMCRDSLLLDSVDVVAAHPYRWKPALSTGLVGHFFSKRGQQLGLGIGAHMVFVPDETGRTAPFPALTLHAGSRNHEIFGGLILSSTDRVEFPNGKNAIRVPKNNGRQVPSFIVRDVGKSAHLYVGIQVFGQRQSEPETQPVDTITVTPEAVTLRKGQSEELQVALKDAKGARLLRRVEFGSSDPRLASVSSAGIILAVSDSGTVVITVSSEQKSKSVIVTLTKAP